MLNLPVYIYLVFGITLILILYGIFYAAAFKRPFVISLSIWISLQGFLGTTGFYTVYQDSPPRFIFLVLPPMIFMLFNLSTKRGRLFLRGFDRKALNLLQTLRIPVELVLYWLFIEHKLPVLMTFEGRNFDLVTGLTAPVVYYFSYVRKVMHLRWQIAWNIGGLILLLNVVVYGLLSAPTPIQRFGFGQPNIAMGYFPFLLLPGFIVPMAILSHVASILQLTHQLKSKNHE